MKKLLNSGNARLFLLVLSLLLLAGAWRAGEAIDAQLRALQVKEVPRVDRGAIPINAQTLYPVWVKQASATLPATQPEGPPLDALFQSRETTKPLDTLPPAPTEPDYAQMFKQAARVDGVSDDGAFINGRFYTVGRKIDELQMSGVGGPVVPVIEAIAAGRITFRVGHQRFGFLAGNQ